MRLELEGIFDNGHKYKRCDNRSNQITNEAPPFVFCVSKSLYYSYLLYYSHLSCYFRLNFINSIYMTFRFRCIEHIYS